jgi:hypothetical protein
MKLTLFTLFCIIIFIAADCKKRGKDCHDNFIFKNNSADTIIFALKWRDVHSLCQLNGSRIVPHAEGGLGGQLYCWENQLTYPNETLIIYIVDPKKYNPPLEFYSCDSIEIKNRVLKHYFLTIDSLRKYNFIISYP